MARRDWPTILDRGRALHAREMRLVGVPPTLRRLHYLLVSDAAATAAGYRNTTVDYKQLSHRTAEARRRGLFPDLSERTRSVEPAVGRSLGTVAGTMRAFADGHRVRRDLELPVQLVLLSEKDGIIPMLSRWFWWLPRSDVHGYNSVTHDARLARLAARDGRQTVALYLGDYDPSGLDISRHLAEQMPFTVRRIALSAEQVAEWSLPPAMPKSGDTRIRGFVAREGELVQVEVDAAPFDGLIECIRTAIFDVSGVRVRERDGLPDLPEVDARERRETDRLIEIADTVEDMLRDVDGGIR